MASPQRTHHATAVVGMVGGGQLARMTHQAAIGLGIDLLVLSPGAHESAPLAGSRHRAGDPDDLAALTALAEECDVVTFDHEHVPNAHLRTLAAAGHAVQPGAEAQHLAQDKLHARRTFAALGLPVPAFAEAAAGDTAAAVRFAAEHGWPIVLKAPVGGYDGRGVQVVEDAAALARHAGFGRDRWLLEEAVPIATELAVVVARRPSGERAAYPVVETVQRDGICVELVSPARVTDGIAAEATELARTIAEASGVAGILAVELFVRAGGTLVVNEIATRPHNSGHATIEGNATSQFENHLRGVLDWPLGSTALRAPAVAMVNVLGPPHPLDPSRTVPLALSGEDVHVHLYRKGSAPGRKLGHVTALGPDHETALARARAAAAALTS